MLVYKSHTRSSSSKKSQTITSVPRARQSPVVSSINAYMDIDRVDSVSASISILLIAPLRRRWLSEVERAGGYV